MLHSNFKSAVASHRSPADTSIGSRGIDAKVRFDHRDELRQDHIFPLFLAVTSIHPETRCTVWNRDNEFTDLSVGDHAIHNSIGPAARTPTRFIFEESMKEVQNRVLSSR